jgi:hypothetical protein
MIQDSEAERKTSRPRDNLLAKTPRNKGTRYPAPSESSRTDKDVEIKLLSRGEELPEPSWSLGNKIITTYREYNHYGT